MYKKLFLFFAFFALPALGWAQDCAEPTWFKTPPKMNGWLIESGLATSRDFQWAKDRAVGRARTQIAKTLNTWVEAVERDIYTDDKDAEGFKDVFKAVSERYTSVSLNETQILKATEPCKVGDQYQVYALVAYPHKINLLKDLGYKVERHDQDLLEQLRESRPMPPAPPTAKPLYLIREPKTVQFRNDRKVSAPVRRQQALQTFRKSGAIKRIVMEVDGIRASDLKLN